MILAVYLTNNRNNKTISVVFIITRHNGNNRSRVQQKTARDEMTFESSRNVQ